MAMLVRASEIRQLALGLLARHGLHDWSFAFNRRKSSLGFCWYAERAIELSWYFAERNSWEAIRDTILHEIAHALVGPGRGHGPVWKAKAIEIGAKPERLGEAVMPPGRWQAQCRQCGGIHHRHRKPKWMRGWYCRRCGQERGRLAWKQVPINSSPLPRYAESRGLQFGDRRDQRAIADCQCVIATGKNDTDTAVTPRDTRAP